MTKQVNGHEAQPHRSRLLEEAQAGEDIVIAKAGVPIARLVPTNRFPRPRGPLKGVWPDLPLDSPFFDPLPDAELEAWEQGQADDPLTTASARAEP